MTDRERGPDEWGPWRTETRAMIEKLGVTVGTLSSQVAELQAGQVENVRRIDALYQITAGLIEADALLSGRMTVVEGRLDAVDQWRAASDERFAAIESRLDALEKPEAPSWQEADDLIDTEFRPVLGIHTGGGSDPKAIAAQMGQRIQAAPIYWKKDTSPKDACQRMLDAGTIPRLELCLPHIWTSRGDRLTGANFWAHVVDGMHDGWIIDLLEPVGELGRPILLSFSHEADLRSEDGASPKNDNPPSDTWCGTYDEYPAYHEHVAALVRQYAPKARIFLNWSGGFGGDVSKRWDAMLPSPGTFDFFGYDFFNMYGKVDGAHWDEFDERLKMFGRFDWYKRTLPDVPLIVGETATCQGGPKFDAGRWLLNMVEFMVDNAWHGVGTGGGISHVLYFSMGYDSHPRCLDDNGTHSHPGCDRGEKWNVLPQIGADDRLGWAAD